MERNHLFRDKLRDTLVEKTKKNPSFSLRAFARQLDIESSSLSQIINGKRTLTDRMCKRLAPKLNLSPFETEKLMNGQAFFEKAKKNTFKTLNEDHYETIAEWYYYAILELTHVNNFQPTNEWIAKVLDLNIHLVNDAVERLLRLGFLEIDEKGRWLDKIENFDVPLATYIKPATRKHEMAKREMAIKAFDDYDVDRRIMGSRTLTGSEKKIKEAKKMCHEFMKYLCEFMEGEGQEDREEVFHLTVSLYPVTKCLEEKS